MRSLGHTELLSLVPRLLLVRKVIQASTEDLPALQDQLEKLIWNKGREEGSEADRDVPKPASTVPGLTLDDHKPCQFPMFSASGAGLGHHTPVPWPHPRSSFPRLLGVSVTPGESQLCHPSSLSANTCFLIYNTLPLITVTGHFSPLPILQLATSFTS